VVPIGNTSPPISNSVESGFVESLLISNQEKSNRCRLLSVKRHKASILKAVVDVSSPKTSSISASRPTLPNPALTLLSIALKNTPIFRLNVSQGISDLFGVLPPAKEKLQKKRLANKVNKMIACFSFLSPEKSDK